jgi:hypothetical protein
VVRPSSGTGGREGARKELALALGGVDSRLTHALARLLGELLQKEGDKLADDDGEAELAAHVALKVDGVDELEGGRLTRLVQRALEVARLARAAACGGESRCIGLRVSSGLDSRARERERTARGGDPEVVGSRTRYARERSITVKRN